MSIESTDIKFYLSGGSENVDPNASLGGSKSSSEIITNVLNNLFDDVIGLDHLAGEIEYRCFFVKNNSAESAANVRIHIDTNTPGTDSDISIGLDPTGAGNLAVIIADEDTPPAGVTFSQPTTYTNGLVIGSLAAGQSYPVWVKRTISAGSVAQALDNVILSVGLDTL